MLRVVPMDTGELSDVKARFRVGLSGVMRGGIKTETVVEATSF